MNHRILGYNSEQGIRGHLSQFSHFIDQETKAQKCDLLNMIQLVTVTKPFMSIVNGMLN